MIKSVKMHQEDLENVLEIVRNLEELIEKYGVDPAYMYDIVEDYIINADEEYVEYDSKKRLNYYISDGILYYTYDSDDCEEFYLMSKQVEIIQFKDVLVPLKYVGYEFGYNRENK